MKFDNQLRYATRIVSDYTGDVPLHAWLKDFYREHRQMGSKDRKLVSNMVYGFYRLGHALRDMPVGERILIGLFLCNEKPQELLQYFRPDWNERARLPLEEKITICEQAHPAFKVTDIFPWKEELSEGIDHAAFCLSFLRQPDLFLRIRPGYQDTVLTRLGQLMPASSGPSAPSDPPSASFAFIPPFTVRLPNGFKVEEVFTPDKEVVVQDYSSQRVASFLEGPLNRDSSPANAQPAQPPSGPHPLSVWDACAASGGKSILAYDLNPAIDLTVSDIRDSILNNLRQRFRQAGITRYHSFTADLSGSAAPQFPKAAGPSGTGAGVRPTGASQPFNCIIVDAPCSGSGTWSRTPEELYFFHPRRIAHYSGLQQKITARVLPFLGNSGSLVYITCSVFKRENEEIAAFMAQQLHHSSPADMSSIRGYDMRADSMFAARFKKV